MLMDQKIFTMGLPDDAITLYLLITGLAEMNQPLTVEGSQSMWNGEANTFLPALKLLLGKGIVKTEAESSLILCPSQMWRN